MEQQVSTSNSRDSTGEPKIISSVHESRIRQEKKKGILKFVITKQTSTGYKSSTNNQPEQHVRWSEVELHCFKNGNRQWNMLMSCGDCGYQTTSNVSLDKHIKEVHLKATTAHQSPTMNKEIIMFQCSHCPFKARSRRTFDQHNSCHGNLAASYQCPVCSYSVSMLYQLNQHLKLHSGEIDENKSSISFGEDHQNAAEEKGGLILSNNNNNTESESRMLRVQDEWETLKSTIINKNTPGKSSSTQANSAPYKVKEQRFPFGQRKGYKCGDCDYQTSFKVSMDMHDELMHPTSSITTTTEGETSEEIGEADTCNNDHQDSEIGDRILPVLSENKSTELEAFMRKQFGVKECRVTLHDMYSSYGKAENPEQTELLPFEEDDQIADVELEDAKIQSLRSRIMTMEEKARIIKEQVTDILSKKANLQKKINGNAESRVLIECDLRLERRSLLEMIIDATKDHRGMMEPVEDKVKSFEKKLDLMDSKLDVLKQEEARLAQELKHAQNSHFGVVQVLEALQSELNVLTSSAYI